MPSHSFPHRITLQDTEHGLCVTQGDHAYIARNWTLSPNVVALVETALSAGLTSMIRNDHPRRNARLPNTRGTVYLAFSPSPDLQWSVAIDTYKHAKADYGHAVFNGKYHEQFARHGIPFTFEARNKGSGHLVVQREFVSGTLAQLARFDHSVLKLGRSHKPRSGFATEYDIQTTLLSDWSKTPFAQDHALVADEFPVDGGYTSRRIDILARHRTTGDWLILELKRAEANLDAVHQVEGYIDALRLRDDFAGGALKGALIAERIPPNVRQAASNALISAYEVHWPGTLTQVA